MTPSPGPTSRDAQAQAAFVHAYVAGCPFAEDRAHAPHLRDELAPVLVAVRGAFTDASVGLGRDHEALAMLTLFGRRAGTLSVTPTALLGLCHALESALRSAGLSELNAADRDVLYAVILEGYVSGREDSLRVAADERAAGAIDLVDLAPRCAALVLHGIQDSDALAARADELGRELLRRDVAACAVAVRNLEPHTRELVDAIAALLDTGVSLGVRWFVAAAAPWDTLLGNALQHPSVAWSPDYPAAVSSALDVAGLQLRSRRGLGARIFQRRKTDLR